MTGATLTTKVLLLAFGIAMIAMASRPISGGPARQPQKKSSAVRANQHRDLQQLGEKIAKAVLDKDIAALLSYDRADLRANDEVALNNPKSDLYCFLFDSSCITWGDGEWRSVYDKLSQAGQLGIQVHTTRSASDHQLYGSLLFYDRSAVSEEDLRSQDFLCKESPTKIASWRFRREAGKWTAVTPLFDSETEGVCPH
jgi:hypothetical protein